MGADDDHRLQADRPIHPRAGNSASVRPYGHHLPGARAWPGQKLAAHAAGHLGGLPPQRPQSSRPARDCGRSRCRPGRRAAARHGNRRQSHRQPSAKHAHQQQGRHPHVACHAWKHWAEKRRGMKHRAPGLTLAPGFRYATGRVPPHGTDEGAADAHAAPGGPGQQLHPPAPRVAYPPPPRVRPFPAGQWAQTVRTGP